MSLWNEYFEKMDAETEAWYRERRAQTPPHVDGFNSAKTLLHIPVPTPEEIRANALHHFEDMKGPIWEILDNINRKGELHGSGKVDEWKVRKIPFHIHHDMKKFRTGYTEVHSESVWGHKLEVYDARLILPNGDWISVFTKSQDKRTQAYNDTGELPLFPKWREPEIPISGLSVAWVSKENIMSAYCGEPNIKYNSAADLILRSVHWRVRGLTNLFLSD